MFNSLCRDYRAISLCIALNIQCTKNYFTDNSCGESSRGSFSPSPPKYPPSPLPNPSPHVQGRPWKIVLGLPAPRSLFVRWLVVLDVIFLPCLLDRPSNAYAPWKHVDWKVFGVWFVCMLWGGGDLTTVLYAGSYFLSLSSSSWKPLLEEVARIVACPRQINDLQRFSKNTRVFQR